MNIRRLGLTLGAVAGLSLMAVAAITVERPTRPDADFGKVSEEMAAAARKAEKSEKP